MMTGEKKEEKGSCEYIMPDDKPCGRDVYDDEHCIFHSEDIEGKRAEFNEKFWKEFERQEKDGDIYDFWGFVFPGDISFKGMKFEKNASFEYTKFSGMASFEYVQFSGMAFFYEAQFSGKVNFWKAQFSRKANFHKSKFFGMAQFGQAEFTRSAYFEYAQFNGDEGVNFRQAQFSGRAYFKYATFHGEANFMKAEFSGDASFRDAQFSGKVYFGDAEFHSKSYFYGVEFEDFNQCNMNGTSFYNVFDLLEHLAENRKEIKHPRGIKYLHEKCKPILGETTVSRLPLLSREIRDDLYLMSFKEKHLKLFSLWWLFADCGRSFLRWALWSLIFAEVFAIIFGLFYYFNPVSFKSEVISFSWAGISFLYYSIVTFTTLGFGDIVPKIPGLQVIIMLEVILGYIMLGGLISILANKLARRS